MSVGRQIHEALARERETRLVLIVSSAVARLREEEAQFRCHYAWPCLSIAGALAESLVATPPRRRPAECVRLLRTTIQGKGAGPVLCTDIDLLFEPALSLDPLRLFRECSRTTLLAVMWPGSYVEPVLSYARPEHDHYRAWKNPQAIILPLCT